MEEKILDACDELKQQNVELLTKIVRIPSITGEEREAQEFLSNHLRELDFQVDLWEPDIKRLFEKYPGAAQYPSHWKYDLILPYSRIPTYEALVESGKIEVLNYNNRPNLKAVWKGTGGGRSLLLSGHMDNVTVEPVDDWSRDPFGAVLEDGKLYGRGTADMKGGLIAAVSALRSLRQAGVSLKGDVIFASAVNEEHGGNGTLAFLDKGITADAAIVMEPSENQIFVATPGNVYWQITVPGFPASPGVRWQEGNKVGVSAIEKLPVIIQSLLKLEEDFNQKIPHSAYERGNPFSCVMGEVEGGAYTTVTANRCILRGCVYFNPGLGSVLEIMESIRRYIENGVRSDPWLRNQTVDTVFLHHRNCSYVDKSHPIVSEIAGAAEIFTGKRPAVSGSPFGADMDILINEGKIPTVIFGPGSIAQAHRPDEYISIDEFNRCVKILALAIYRWCR